MKPWSPFAWRLGGVGYALVFIAIAACDWTPYPRPEVLVAERGAALEVLATEFAKSGSDSFASFGDDSYRVNEFFVQRSDSAYVVVGSAADGGLREAATLEEAVALTGVAMEDFTRWTARARELGIQSILRLSDAVVFNMSQPAPTGCCG